MNVATIMTLVSIALAVALGFSLHNIQILNEELNDDRWFMAIALETAIRKQKDIPFSFERVYFFYRDLGNPPRERIIACGQTFSAVFFKGSADVAWGNFKGPECENHNGLVFTRINGK